MEGIIKGNGHDGQMEMEMEMEIIFPCLASMLDLTVFKMKRNK